WMGALVGVGWLGLGCGGGSGNRDAAVDVLLPDGQVGSCDPSSDTGGGCTGTNNKCSLTFPDPMSNDSQIRCTTGGPNDTGQPCTRTGDGTLAGLDDCRPGNYCSALAVANGRACRRICTAQTTNVCAGLACLVLGYPWGSCRAGCDIFAATSPCPQSN